MCGIAGFFGRRPMGIEIVQAMFAALANRGPDARHVHGWDRDRPVADGMTSALLHTRLSIRDVSRAADQPMSNRDGSIWICYNGEIYGWEEDRRRLEAEGVAFRTWSDTEYILYLYERDGLAFLPKLRGMFALVIADFRARKVYALRDRLGLKPLVYYHDQAEFAFASTVRALLPYLPLTARDVSASAIDAFLAHRYIPAPHTVFARMHRLENGHYLVYDMASSQLTKHRYWHAQAEPVDPAQCLADSVSIRTASDRPVGLFLSGGVDSNAIASVLVKRGYGNIDAFTAGFRGSRMDESALASEFAHAHGLRHEVLPIGPGVGDEFNRIVQDLDEPFADPSAFPLWFLARETSKRVKVVLSGDGGDELFGGYKRYAKHLRTRWRPRLPFLPVLSAGRRKGAGRIIDELRLGWQAAYGLRFSGFSPSQRRFLQPDFSSPQPVYWRGLEARGRTLDALLQIDMQNYLPDYVLRKGDLCTMAHGLELRAPLLDYHFYQSVMALDSAARFSTPPKSFLLQQCPADVRRTLSQKKKSGFNPPVAEWLDHELADRLVGLGARLAERTNRQLHARAVDDVVQFYRRGERNMAEQVLQLLMLDESLGQLRTLAARSA